LDIGQKISEIFDRWVVPMLADIRRILELTHGKAGRHNHGANFSANALILNGIDFVSNFHDYPEEAVIEKYTKRKTALVKKLRSMPGLDEGEKGWLVGCLGRERGPRSETEAAEKFIRDFFPDAYKGIAEVLWSVFRHGHTHLFLPKTLRGAKDVIPSAVGWVYRPRGNRMGLRVADIEGLIRKKGWESVRHAYDHLRVTSEGFFGVTAHLFFLDFVRAVRKFRMQVEDPTNVKARDAFARAFDQWRSDIQIKGSRADELIRKIRRVTRKRIP